MTPVSPLPAGMISTREELEQTVRGYGLLPFFSNSIPGFSVEEMAAPGMLFGGGEGDDGCWEWKGPVIREQTTAYGKFFRRKAGFVSLELYPDFINFRRAAYPLDPESVEAALLNIIKENEAATSAGLREIVFGAAAGARRGSFGGGAGNVRPRRQALEAPLQKLQMGGRLLIADFEYKYTARGDRYGWGVALYTLPEIWFGKDIARTGRSPEESFDLLTEHLAGKLPGADRSQIAKLLS